MVSPESPQIPAAQAARDYLKGRGITAEVAKSWQLGYAPDSWDALLLMLREKGFSNDEIAQSGLSSSREGDEGGRAKTYARFRDRVMFPIRNDYGEVIAFSGRVLDPDAKTAKYVNSPETPLFTKGKVLYALDKSKRALIEAEAAVVCEGQLDTISAFEHGVKNVIAPQGTAFTTDQARLLSRFVETVFLCFDSDRAGQEAVTKSLPALLDCGLNVKVVRLPEGEDPDSLIRGKGVNAFREAIAQAKDFFDNALDILEKRTPFSDPNASAAAAKRLSPYLAMITNPILRETWTNKVAQRLGITGAMLTAQLQAALGQDHLPGTHRGETASRHQALRRHRHPLLPRPLRSRLPRVARLPHRGKADRPRRPWLPPGAHPLRRLHSGRFRLPGHLLFPPRP